MQSNPVNTSNLGQINMFAFNESENKLPLNPIIVNNFTRLGEAYK